MSASTTVEQTMQALTFRIHDELMAIDAAIVREILDPVPITRVPNASRFAFGLINVRGTVVPLIDLRVPFGMPQEAQGPDARIIVVEVGIDGEALVTGILANSVHEVTEIDASSFETVPRLGTKWPPGIVSKIGKRNDGFIVVPDMHFIFNTHCGHSAAN